MKQAPLMTDWVTRVDTNCPLPEYPRPQLVRSDWLCLNGIWQFQPSATNAPVPTGQTLTSEIMVPFPMESALSGVMQYYPHAWYRRTFTVPPGWSGRRIILHLDAVDWESELFINGQSVGQHRGGYDSATYDITSFLSGSGPQELIVRVFDPTDNAGQPRGKQTLYPGGIMYTSCSGIWQSVWLEPVSTTSVGSLRLVPDIDNQKLKVTVAANGVTSGVTVHANARAGTTVVGSTSGVPGVELLVPVPNPTLWSPTNPFLYDLTVTLSNGPVKLDSVESYFGMRKISLGTNGGFVKILLNDQFVFQFGPLDQGFWPDAIYTPPTEAALKAELEQTKVMGFNMIRKHIKVEPARWYYWADKLGLLVWQDMPSVNSYTGNPQPIDTAQFQTELMRMVQSHWNHPSIIMWVVFNEGQGQHDTAALVAEVKSLDPSRLVNQASGGNYAGAGDVLDSHSYPNPSCPSSATQAVVCGEFGGVGLGITNHAWAGGWGYVGAVDGDDLTARFEGFCTQLSGFVQNQGLSAAVYTQITDVETELNGLYTYDRKVFKPVLSRMQAAVRSTVSTYSTTTIVPTSKTNAQSWRYTTATQATNWFATNFNASGWSTGNGGFGTASTPGAVVGTTWNTADIWLRRTFNPGPLTSAQITNLIFNCHHDEAVEIYINGIFAGSATGYTTTYSSLPMNAAGQAAIMQNATNLLAVHCHQTGGGQFIDVGIDARILVSSPSATPPPFILLHPNSQFVTIGQPASFDVSALGTAPLNYQWKKGAVNIPGATGTNFTLNAVTTNDAGNYTVEVRNSAGAVTSVPAVLTVDPVIRPPNITLQPTNLTVQAGSSASFRVTADGSVPLRYQWRKGGVDIASATNSAYTIASVTTNDTGGFTVVVTNMVGSVTSAVATLTVNLPIYTPPALLHRWSFTDGTDSVAGSNATLIGSASYAGGRLQLPGGGVFANYASVDIGYTISNHPSLSVETWFSMSALQNWSKVWMFGRDAGGQPALSYINFTPRTGVGGNPPKVDFDSASANELNTLGGANPPAMETGNEYHVVVVFDATKNLMSYYIDGALADSGSMGGANVTSLNANLARFGAGFFYTDADLSGSINELRIWDGPLSASHILTNHAAGPGQVPVYAIAPQITTQPENKSALAGDTVTFSVVASGTGPLAYQWRFFATNLPGATTSSLTLPDVLPANAGPYIVVVTNSGGSVTSAVATLTVSVPPPIISSAAMLAGPAFSVSGTGVIGQPYILQATTNLAPIISWTSLATNTAGGNQLFQFIDNQVRNHQWRFYRVATP